MNNLLKFLWKVEIVVMKPIDKVARQTVEPSWLLREGSQFMSVQTTGAWNAGPLSGHKCFCNQKKNLVIIS